MTSTPDTATPDAATLVHNHARRVLAASSAAHFLHDGATELIYVLLPVWQAQFGFSLAALGLLRSIYMACLAGFQLPSGLVAERLGERRTLALGTCLVGVGFLALGALGGVLGHAFAGSLGTRDGIFLGLAFGLALAGLGASVQHPIGSALTARAYEGRHLRAALGTYNFSGDLGKTALPALTATLIALWQWRLAIVVIGLGLVVASAIILWATKSSDERGTVAAPEEARRAPTLAPEVARRGFLALSSIAVFDSVSRAGFLVLLPFLLKQKGADLPTIGLALSLVFAGGAAGKFVCGLAARKVGILRTVILTEGATAIFMIAVFVTSLDRALILLPLLGLALNGTSSVLYGTVAELFPAERRARAFAIFYTVGLSASALTPALFGALSDGFGMGTAITVAAVAALLVTPLTWPLKAPLAQLESGAGK
jgi:MFS family permease